MLNILYFLTDKAVRNDLDYMTPSLCAMLYSVVTVHTVCWVSHLPRKALQATFFCRIRCLDERMVHNSSADIIRCQYILN